MVTPELKWPTTNLTPSPTNLLATDTPCLGSDTSSPGSTSTFCPRMPPALLMSSTACSTPWVSCAPNAALAPGDRSRNANLDLRVRCAGEPKRQRDGNGLQKHGPHVNLPYRFNRLARSEEHTSELQSR